MSNGFIGATPIPRLSETIYAGTLTEATRVLTVPGGYSVGNIRLFINGLIIDPKEYTAIDGSTIDLGQSFSAGTKFYVEESRGFTVASHYSKVEADARFANLNSPAFTGNPTAPTPAQFDNDTSLATTEFVQRSAGAKRGLFTPPTANYSITTADLGKTITPTAANSILSLPAANSVPAGTTVYIAPSNTWTVNVTGGGSMVCGASISGTNVVTSLSGLGGDLTATSDGTTYWWLSGTAVLAYNGLFGRNLSDNGYQKLPGGLIMQWGRVGRTVNVNGSITFPLAFGGLFAFVASAEMVGANGYVFRPNNPSSTGFSYSWDVWNTTGNGNNCVIDWIALGY